MGFLFLVLAGKTIVGGARAYFWRATPCTVVESQRTTQGLERSGGSDARILIRYRYEADGAAHTSDRLSLGAGVARDTRAIERLLLDFPAGRRTQCWVNPANPAEAVLVRDSLWPALMLLVPLVFVAVGVGGIILVWRAKPRAENAEPARTSQPGGKLLPRIFFAFFLVFGAVGVGFITVRPAVKMLAARGWPAVPCEVESSRVQSHSGDDGATYSVDILYRYRIRDREFHADRYDFIGGSSSGFAGKNEVVRRHPAGTRTVCFVNPNDPTDAVLARGPQPVMWFGLLPLIFLLIGLAGLRSTFRKTAKESRAVLVSHGAVELKPTASPVMKLLGAILLAAFWNGIVSVFAYQLVTDWRRGERDWFLGIFLMPFVLIGLLFLGFIGSCLLNLFNPRVRLVVGSAVVPPGGRLDARWSVGRGADRIRRLCIVLEGREESRGESSSQRTFARIPLIETDNTEHIRAGSAQAAIPADVQPTSEDDASPRIVWALKVRGEIARFPNVEDEFPITILPRAGA